LKYIEAWKKEDNSIQLPLSYKQRKELEGKIRAGKRTPDEENFDEAIANTWRLGSTDHVRSLNSKHLESSHLQIPILDFRGCSPNL
jgi:amyloid beta precursor protein binding protein 1